MHVRPDDTPPTVHVDPPDDVMAEHRRDELAAAQEKIEDLELEVSGFITIVKEKEQEIVELRAARAGLEDRVRRMETERADEFAAFLLRYCGQTDADLKVLMEGAKEFIPGVFEALERSLAAKQESAPPTQPAAQTWKKIVDIYLASDGDISEDHPKFVAAAVHWADDNGIDVEKLSDGCGAKAIWYATAKNCSVENTWRDTFHEISEEILRRFGSGEPHSLASIIKSFGGYWAGEKIDISGVLDMMFPMTGKKRKKKLAWQ